MSGDNLRHMAAGDTAGNSPTERLTPLVSGHSLDRTSTAADSEVVWDGLLSSVDDAVADGGGVAVDNSLVTESLDEILLAMIASLSNETHGTGLMNELERRFDVQLSPGTVYPRLHDLDEDDTLAVHELVQTKQYSINDRSEAKSRIERAVQQHLAMSMFLQTALDAM